MSPKGLPKSFRTMYRRILINYDSDGSQMAKVGKLGGLRRETSDLYATYEQILFLENSKTSSESFIYLIPDIIAIINREARILKANLAAEKMVSADKGELLNSSLSKFFSTKNWNIFRDKINKLCQSTSVDASIEFDLSTDGVDIRCREYHWKIIFLHGLNRRKGKLMTVIGHDITQIRKMFVEIKDSHARLRNHSKELKNLLKVIENQKTQILEGSKLAQLGEMAGGIAQEIDSPIESLRGNPKVS